MKKSLLAFLIAAGPLCVFAQLPSYLPTNGLVGWWPFNGNANDESGNGNNGTVINAGLSQDRFGNPNSCYLVDGIDCPTAKGVSLPVNLSNASEYSIHVWYFTSDSLKDSQAIFNSSPHQYVGVAYNYVGWGNVTSGGIGNGVWLNAGPTGTIQWSTYNMLSWHSITITKELSQYKFYGDGVLKYTYPIFPAFNSGYIDDLIIGASSINGGVNCYEVFKGKLDDIGIWNRALTPQEITALYTGSPTNNNGGGNTAAANVPSAISYQAVARNAQGQPLSDAAVQVKFTLLTDSLTGAAEYSESHSLTTNALGLFTTAFGAGTPISGTFTGINWASGSKYLKVELDAGNGFVDMGTQQLLSVPYSMRSNTSAKAGTIENSGLPVYADNAAALASGLLAGQMYRTATGDLKIVY